MDCAYLPDAEHGVVWNVVRRQGELVGRVLRRQVLHGLDLADDAAVRDEDAAAGLRHARQQGNHQQVGRADLSQVLGQPHDALEVEALLVVAT